MSERASEWVSRMNVSRFSSGSISRLDKMRFMGDPLLITQIGNGNPRGPKTSLLQVDTERPISALVQTQWVTPLSQEDGSLEELCLNKPLAVITLVWNHTGFSHLVVLKGQKGHQRKLPGETGSVGSLLKVGVGWRWMANKTERPPVLPTIGVSSLTSSMLKQLLTKVLSALPLSKLF